MSISYGENKMIWGVCISVASSHLWKGTECSFSWEQNQNKQGKLLFIRWGQRLPREPPLPVKPLKRRPRESSLLVGQDSLPLARLGSGCLQKHTKECAPLCPSLHLNNSMLTVDSGLIPSLERLQSPSFYTAEQQSLGTI